MSLSNINLNSGSKSPIKRFYKWNGSSGNFSYYDKETETNIIVESPITIIPIDKLSLVEGFNSKAGKGFRSNEVRSTSKEELEVRWHGGSAITSGLYKDIKEKVNALGGHFHLSIYFIQQIDGKWELCNLKLKGSALSAYLDAEKVVKNFEGLLVTIDKGEKDKTGNVEYFRPKITGRKASETDHQTAVNMDIELQSYFNDKKNAVEFEAPLTDEEKKQLVKPKAEKVSKSNNKIEEQSQEDFFEDNFK